MNHLTRNLAPVSDPAWERIEAEAVRTLNHFQTARQLVDVVGPSGWTTDSAPRGHVEEVTDLDDASRAYPIITGEYSDFPGWQRRPIEVGRAVAKPIPDFVKLDTSIIDEELERLG